MNASTIDFAEPSNREFFDGGLLAIQGTEPSCLKKTAPQMQGSISIMGDLALSYAGDGLEIFPCDPVTKKPLCPHGFHDATTDEFQVRRWWKNHPGAMIGWPTKGHCVVDVDLPQGPDSLKALEVEHGPLPVTRTVRTPSGGTHYIFKSFESVKNSASGIGSDLDIRGEGGYIILAGSVNADGKAYEALVDVPPANAPGELIMLANSCKSGEAKRQKKEPISDRPTAAPRMPSSGASPYGTAALDRGSQNVRTAAQGERNATLNDVTYSLGTLVAGGELPEAEVVAELTAAAMSAGLEPREIEATLKSGLEAGKLSPRTATHYTTPNMHEQALARHHFSFSSCADLCRNPAATKWLIKDLLPENIIALIFGGSGSGKTFCMLDICLSIASQVEECLGHSVKKHGAVFYIAGEGFHGLGKRIKAWSKEHGVSPETIKFFASNQAVDMLDPASVAEMLLAVDNLAATHSHPVLIVIDTLNRNFGPGDENSTSDMTAFVSALDRVKNQYQCGVFVVHHSGLGDADRSRGSSALRGALDMEFKLAVTGENRILTCTKSKDTEPPPPTQLATKIIDLGEADEDGWAITSMVFEVTDTPATKTKPLSANCRMALDALEFIHGEKDSIHLDEWRKEFYARSTADNVEAKKKSFQRARQDLLSSHKIANRDDQYWIIVATGQAGRDGT